MSIVGKEILCMLDYSENWEFGELTATHTTTSLVLHIGLGPLFLEVHSISDIRLDWIEKFKIYYKLRSIKEQNLVKNLRTFQYKGNK
jgi:hypothetical protein